MSEKILIKILIKTWREDPDEPQSLGPPRVRQTEQLGTHSPVTKGKGAQT